jgi:hypothetical protein
MEIEKHWQESHHNFVQLIHSLMDLHYFSHVGLHVLHAIPRYPSMAHLHACPFVDSVMFKNWCPFSTLVDKIEGCCNPVAGGSQLKKAHIHIHCRPNYGKAAVENEVYLI